MRGVMQARKSETLAEEAAAWDEMIAARNEIRLQTASRLLGLADYLRRNPESDSEHLVCRRLLEYAAEHDRRMAGVGAPPARSVERCPPRV